MNPFPESSYPSLAAACPAADGSTSQTYFYDHNFLVKECDRLKAEEPAVVAELLAIGEGLVEGHIRGERDGRFSAKPGQSLWAAQPRLKYLAYLPWIHQLSGEQRHLDLAIASFNEWWEDRGDYNALDPQGRRRVFAGPEYGRLLESLCRFYCGLDHDKVDERTLTRLRLTLVQHADVLFREQLGMHFSNVYFFKLLGVISVSLAIPEWRDGMAAREEVHEEILRCLRAQFRMDGGHVEQSPNYARAVLRSFGRYFVLCDRNGFAVPDDNWAMYLKAGLAYQNYSDGSNGSLALGDTQMRADFDWGISWWALGLRASDALRLPLRVHHSWLVLGLGPMLKERVHAPPLPDLTSTGLADTGYYFMRHPERPDTVLTVDCGPHGHYHGHYDLLAVTLSIDGVAVLPDPGCHPYDMSARRLSAMSTFWHSTVCLDTQNHHSWEDGEPPLGVVEQWHVADDGSCSFSAWHDGYAHWCGAPRIHRQIWYNGDDCWVIVDRLACQGEERRERDFAFISSFNLPTETEFEQGADGSWLRTTLPKQPNMLVVVNEPETIDHISVLPSVHCGNVMPEDCRRLSLVTNAFATSHVTVIHGFRIDPKAIDLKVIDDEHGALKIVLTSDTERWQINAEPSMIVGTRMGAG